MDRWDCVRQFDTVLLLINDGSRMFVEVDGFRLVPSRLLRIRLTLAGSLSLPVYVERDACAVRKTDCRYTE